MWQGVWALSTARSGVFRRRSWLTRPSPPSDLRAHMGTWLRLGCLVLGCGLCGCGARAVGSAQPVTVVATRTPGVAMVIVRPSFTKDSSRGGVDRQAQYVLLCDGRAPDGMHCETVSEVSRDRRSRGVMPDRPAPIVDEGVGTLSDFSIRHSGDESVARDVNPPTSPPAAPQPREESAAPPPAPPAAPPAAPPPPVDTPRPAPAPPSTGGTVR